MARGGDRLWVAAVTALGGYLRACQIGGKGLWIDEAFSVWLGWQPVGEMLGWLVRIDQHPPLYYLLLHFWMILGDDPSTVRALSALCGTLTIPVVYLLGRRLAGDKVGFLTALILAVSPFHVRFAQETRMYTLLTLNASLALYALAWLFTDPRSAEARLGRQFVDFWRGWRTTRRRPPMWVIETDLAWLGYVLFTAAMLLTHNTAVFFPVATNIIVLLLVRLRIANRESRITNHGFLRNWLLAQVGVFLLWSLWLPAFAVQGVGVYREFWLPAPTWSTVAGAVGAFVSDFLPLPPAGLCAVGVLYAGLALLGLVHFRRRPAHVLFLLVTFTTPFVGEWLVSLYRPIFYDRTLIWASLPLYLLLAAGIRQLHHRSYIIGVILVVLVVNTLSLREYYVNFEKEQWDDAALFVAGRVEAGDLILFNATWTQIPFDYYFRRYERSVAEHGVPVDLFDRGVLEPEMSTDDLPRLRVLVRSHERVWLVYSHDWYTDPQGLIPLALEEELDLLDRWDFYGLQVRLYGR
ncbi:MAG: glycosyltransferase family 39 protein [Chloroflexota bacterium]|nr:glycosyltransferase family 39 protein [Chloroflexota bacterium]